MPSLTPLYAGADRGRLLFITHYLLRGDRDEGRLTRGMLFGNIANKGDGIPPQIASGYSSIEDLPNVIEQNIASVILKLEHILFVPETASDELLHELHNLLSSPSVLITFNSLSNVLKNHIVQVDESIVKELAKVVCKTNPLAKAFAKDGPLATAYKRKQYYEEHFNVVNPVEYILNP